MGSVSLQFELVTPEGMTHEGESQFVVVPGSEGEIGALPDHSPLLTTVRAGEVSSEESAGVARFVVSAGVAEVLPERVTVIVTHAIALDRVNVEKTRQVLTEVTEDIRGRAKEDPELWGLEVRRDFAQACLDAAQRKMVS